MAADRFGGSPKINNLVSQLSDVNLKQYMKIEEIWAVALKETPPKKVTVDVDIIFTLGTICVQRNLKLDILLMMSLVL